MHEEGISRDRSQGNLADSNSSAAVQLAHGVSLLQAHGNGSVPGNTSTSSAHHAVICILHKVASYNAVNNVFRLS